MSNNGFISVPSDKAAIIERLEQTFKMLEQQLMIAQLNIANAKASFRICELEILSELNLSPNEFTIDRVDNQIVVRRRESSGHSERTTHAVAAS